MESEKFCLRWNDFETNISSAFRELRDDKNFFDVTLACDDEQIQAHKVILSACSQFFRNILRRNPHQHPLLYLKGVKYAELQSVLNFMYHGEVNVAQEELNSFLAVAEDLKIKGLTQKEPTSQTNQPSNKNIQPKSNSKQISRPKPLPPQPHLIQEDDDDVQEIISIKAEPRESHPMTSDISAHSNVYSVSAPVALLATDPNEAIIKGQQDYEDYPEYDEDQHFADVDTAVNHGVNTGVGRVFTGREDEFENFLKENSGQIEGGTWSCYLCGKITSGSGNMRQHFEAYHFSLGGIQCDLCMKMFKTKHSLATHVSKVHRNR